jgi:hypothetical protein
MSGKLTLGGFVILAGGFALLVGSFLHVFGNLNAWSGGYFPLVSVPVIIGLVMAGEILLRAFAPDVRLPPVLGFTWAQIHLLLGIWAALMMVSFATGDSFVSPLTPPKGTGLWLMLGGAIALVLGAIVQLPSRRRHLH